MKIRYLLVLYGICNYLSLCFNIPNFVNVVHKSQNQIQEKFEILNSKVINDTLEILSSSNFLYYPAGKFSNTTYFEKNNKEIKRNIELFIRYDTEKDSLINYSYGNSYIKFIFDEEKNAYEIISANIIDDNYILNKQIKIGLSKTNFMLRFSRSFDLNLLKNINVIKFVSALEGIWHYYYFRNDILIQIKFETDYQL
jgi:hypothetical protein